MNDIISMKCITKNTECQGDQDHFIGVGQLVDIIENELAFKMKL